jgi:hypothetical protein
MLEWLKLETPEYLEQIDRENKFDDKLMESLTEAIRAFKMIYKFSYGK